MTGSGQPYPVLEHVEGLPIDRYVTEQALSLPARLSLLIDLSDAAVHAHCHLVVHRDLKPANVMLNREGQVKWLDFGIAKLLITDVADQASFNFASGSLPALQYVGQIPLNPSTTCGYWLLSLEVQGNVAASRPKSARVPANFQVVCQLPVTVQQWVNQ